MLQREGAYALQDSKGRYTFDDTSGWLTAATERVGRVLCKTLGWKGRRRRGAQEDRPGPALRRLHQAHEAL